MKTKVTTPGFSLIELLAVVGIIGVLAAISVPLIMNWMRFYRLRAAMQEVSSELLTARSQAVMKSANRGIVLEAVDSNSFRYVNLDLAASADPNLVAQASGPVRTLPQTVVFNSAAFAGETATSGVRFSRLGGACWIGAANPNCNPTLPACTDPGCGDNTSTAVKMSAVPATGDTHIRLLDQRNGLFLDLTIQLNGRVFGQ